MSPVHSSAHGVRSVCRLSIPHRYSTNWSSASQRRLVMSYDAAFGMRLTNLSLLIGIWNDFNGDPESEDSWIDDDGEQHIPHLVFQTGHLNHWFDFTACLRELKSRLCIQLARLFSFAGSLRCPDRGGRSVNLSARVLAQLELFDSGQSAKPTSFIKRRGT